MARLLRAIRLPEFVDATACERSRSEASLLRAQFHYDREIALPPTGAIGGGPSMTTPASDEQHACLPTRDARAFATTHWSVVIKAADSGSQEGQTALAELCRIYWYPLY